jgi:DNA-binding transcriptional regulator YbjK
VPGRKTEERQNIFDSIKKPPSIAMEKIQSSTSATLDRMAQLQNRYRQHKETMNSSDNSSERSRRTSTSTIDSSVSFYNLFLLLKTLLSVFILYTK